MYSKYQILFIVLSVFQVAFSFAVFMIFTIGLDLETKSDKIELSKGWIDLLKQSRSFIFSVKEIIPSPNEIIEPSSLGYVAFSQNLCNCSNSFIKKGDYQNYSNTIFYVSSEYYCRNLQDYGCHFIPAGSPFKEYFSYNNHRYLISSKDFEYQYLLANSVESGENCPRGKYKCKGYFDRFQNHYCVDNQDQCPLTSVTVNGKQYGGENEYFLTTFGLNVSRTEEIEQSYLLKKGRLINSEITKYELFNENGVLNDLSKTYFKNAYRYSLNDGSLNHSMAILVYQAIDYNTSGMKKRCFDSIIQIEKIAKEFNEMIYSTFNNVSFGLSVGWIGAAFYFVFIGCAFQQECPIVTCILFMLLTILSYVQFITNSIFLTKITDNKFDFNDECELYQKVPVNKLHRNRTLVTICEWFLLITTVLGTIISYCLVKMCIKKYSNKSSDPNSAKNILKRNKERAKENIGIESNQPLMAPTNSSDFGYINNINYSPYQVNLNSPVIFPYQNNIPLPQFPQGPAPLSGQTPIPSNIPPNYLNNGIYIPPQGIP